jgi:hypothetical protein
VQHDAAPHPAIGADGFNRFGHHAVFKRTMTGT